MPSAPSIQSLKRYWLKRHLFCMSRFWIPKPSCSFGWHKIFPLLVYMFQHTDIERRIPYQYSLTSCRKVYTCMNTYRSYYFIKKKTPDTKAEKWENRNNNFVKKKREQLGLDRSMGCGLQACSPAHFEGGAELGLRMQARKVIPALATAPLFSTFLKKICNSELCFRVQGLMPWSFN